jgi:hypothetical protein
VCGRLVVAQRSAAVAGELLGDKGDQIFQALELALVPAADMLDAAAPVVGIGTIGFVYDEP